MTLRLIAAALLLCAQAGVSAQAPVRLDVQVTDGGMPVDGLTAQDFDVFEDGTRQTVTDVEPVRPPQNGHARVIVLFIEAEQVPRIPLARFVDRLAGDGDLVALVTPQTANAALTLGPKRDVISAIAGDPARPSDPKVRLYGQCYPDTRPTAGVADELIARRRETLAFDALDTLVARLGEIREERKAVVVVTEGWRLFRESRELVRDRERQRERRSDPFNRRSRSQEQPAEPAGISMTECEADRAALARIDNSERLRTVAERANRSLVTFYPITPEALTGTAGPSGGSAEESARQLALETGGQAIIGAADVDSGIGRIVADVSSYYLVTYTPTNGVIDGGFRQVSVRVRRPGLRVRARRGYRAPTAWELTGVGSDVSRAFADAAEESGRSQFRLRASAWPRTDASGVRGLVWAVGELDPRTRSDVGWTAGAVADLLVVNAAGKEVVSTPIDVDADTGTFTALVSPEPLPPGEYAVRVNVRPVLERGLPVTDVARVTVPASAAVLSEPVLWHRSPVTGPRFVAAADPRFMRSERVRLELATAEPGQPSARLLDRQGSPLPVPVGLSERPDSSGAFRWLQAEVALAPLTIGSYAIEVTLDGATRVMAFSVVP